MNITIEVDNTALVKEKLVQQCLAAMVDCGQTGEAFAALKLRDQIGKGGYTPTGTLMGSIMSAAYQESESSFVAEIGTNVEYGVYVELGTGIYYDGGRDTPWRYQDAKGNWWTTQGQPAKPYLKPAVADHADEYKAIIEENLKR